VLQFTSQKQIDSIIDHAKEEYPYECCGIIAGRDSRVESVIRINNELSSSVEYSMNDAELKSVLDELDAAGLDFIGVYHSHPTSGAYPSGIDIKRSIFPEVDYLIVSLVEQNDPKIGNFKIIDGKAKEEPYSIGD
jgi:proteasome lid subunit RPN8/RPN11